jgi:hypothetical protein
VEGLENTWFVVGAMFTGVKSADTPVTPTKESSNARGVSTSSLCMPSIKPIVHVVLVYKRVGGWEKLIEPLSPPFSIGKIRLNLLAVSILPSISF